MSGYVKHRREKVSSVNKRQCMSDVCGTVWCSELCNAGQEREGGQETEVRLCVCVSPPGRARSSRRAGRALSNTAADSRQQHHEKHNTTAETRTWLQSGFRMLIQAVYVCAHPRRRRRWGRCAWLDRSARLAPTRPPLRPRLPLGAPLQHSQAHSQ